MFKSFRNMYNFMPSCREFLAKNKPHFLNCPTHQGWNWKKGTLQNHNFQKMTSKGFALKAQNNSLRKNIEYALPKHKFWPKLTMTFLTGLLFIFQPFFDGDRNTFSHRFHCKALFKTSLSIRPHLLAGGFI